MLERRQILNVLVVEDDPADRAILLRLLEQLPYWNAQIVPVASLKEALQALDDSWFALAMVDLNLPDASGLETINRLRAAKPHLPLIVVSGMEDRELSHRTLRAGVQDYVIKDDLSLHVLLKAVDQSMAKAALERELRLSRQQTMQNALLQQNEAIRAEIGGELHDVLSQNLTAMTLLLKRMEKAVAPEAKASLSQNLSGLLDQAIRDVERLSHGLFPPELERRGLNQALEELVLHMGSLHEIPCRYSGEEVDVPGDVALHLFRIVQESLSNAIKHAAPSLVSVHLESLGTSMRLEVRDDGCGFDADDTSEGLGRSTMQYRADAIGATLDVLSRLDVGTKVVCDLPFSR